MTQKLPKCLLDVYKEMFQFYNNEKLDDDAIVLPVYPERIYDLSPQNLMVCY